MSSNRGLANDALYSARILIDAWESASAGGPGAEPVARAFRPAVLLHLARAYGWGLLAVAGADVETDPQRLPRNVAEVPAPPVGRSVTPELREFQILEREGWIGELLAAEVAAPAPRASTGMLGSDRSPVGPGELGDWVRRLAATLDRMDDLLAEC